MITLIIKNYLTLLLSIGIGSLIIFSIGVLSLYWLFKKSPSKHYHQETALPIEAKQDTAYAHDISAIAGDDKIATQLDLARAYVETGKHRQAKTILQEVSAQGNLLQQQEAQSLLAVLLR